MRYGQQSAGDVTAGFSLVAILWIILAISAILTPLTLAARTDTSHTASVHQTDRLNHLAEGLAHVLMAQVQAAKPTETRALNSTPQSCTSNGLTIVFVLQSHGGLINVNHAPEATLVAALTALDLGRSAAKQIAADIVIHRSPAANNWAAGETNIAHGPKNARLESLSELYDIKGLESVAFQKLHRTFSTYKTGHQLMESSVPEHLVKAAGLQPFFVKTPVHNATVQSIPVTITVAVRAGDMTGQYNAVHVRIQGGSATHWIAEYWRYDELVLDTGASTHPDCTAVFGPQIGTILESFS